MSKQVFVAMAEEIEDYCKVVGVYDDRKRAEKVAEALHGSDGYVVERAFNEPWYKEIASDLVRWHVRIDHGGDTHGVKRSRRGFFHSSFECVPHCNTLLPLLLARVWARDKEHAVEVANGIRVRLVASGEWDELVKAGGGPVSEEA